MVQARLLHCIKQVLPICNGSQNCLQDGRNDSRPPRSTYDEARATSNAMYPHLLSVMRQLKTLCRAAGSPVHVGPHPLYPDILYIYQKASRVDRATSNPPYPHLVSVMRQLKTFCRATGSPVHVGPHPSPPHVLYIYHDAARAADGTRSPARPRSLCSLYQ